MLHRVDGALHGFRAISTHRFANRSTRGLPLVGTLISIPFQVHDPNMHATKLLAYDEKQLIKLLRNQPDGENGIVSNLVGVVELTKAQRDELGRKLR